MYQRKGVGHGVLPAYCSQQVYRRAREPKEIHITRGATHVLNEARIDVHEIVRRWIGERVGKSV